MNKPLSKPALRIQPTTLWDYPSQHYGASLQGDPNYIGATPSYIIWNLLQRYTQEGDIVVDPCCGSGTTLDVCTDLGRQGVGYDVNPTRDEIQFIDSRKMPMGDSEADFVFIDPPYGTHVDYSDDPRCIGKLEADGDEYYAAMGEVIDEAHRILKPGAYFALYVSDSYEKKGLNKGFHPIGFELFGIMSKKFTPIDIVSVIRHNKTLEMGNYRKAAEEGNFYLRGFNYLFIMQKPGGEDRQKVRHTETVRNQHPIAEKKSDPAPKKGWKSKYKTVNGKLVRVQGDMPEESSSPMPKDSQPENPNTNSQDTPSKPSWATGNDENHKKDTKPSWATENDENHKKNTKPAWEKDGKADWKKDSKPSWKKPEGDNKPSWKKDTKPSWKNNDSDNKPSWKKR